MDFFISTLVLFFCAVSGLLVVLLLVRRLKPRPPRPRRLLTLIIEEHDVPERARAMPPAE